MTKGLVSVVIAALVLVPGASLLRTALAAQPAAQPAAAGQPVKGDAAAGAGKAATCTACHGVNGNSVNPEWPSLAGQHATYVVEQLQLFKAKKRLNPIMQPLAEPLSEQDMADLGAFFGQQTPNGLEADPSYWQAGEKLYRGGDRARSIPACVACHGRVGRGNPASLFPALQAQHSVYTVKQLNDYATQARYAKDDKGRAQAGQQAQMMAVVATRLTPEDRRNLASYIQGMR